MPQKSTKKKKGPPRTLARNLSIREEMRSVIMSCEVASQQLKDDMILLESELALEALTSTVSRRGNIWLCGNGSGFCLAMETAAKLSAPASRFELPTRAAVLGLNGAISSTSPGRGGLDDALASELMVYGRRGDSLWCFASDSSSKTLLSAVSRAHKELDIPVVLFSEYPGTPLIRYACAKVRIQPTDDRDRANYCVHWAHSFIANVICSQLKRASRKAGT